MREAKRAVAALDELRATAPAFAEQARALAAKEQFAEAIEKLDYAIKLRPDAAEYLVAKGDLLQCQLKLAEAAAIYREALRVQPGLARAEASAKLCDELLAAPPGADGKLTRESLAQAPPRHAAAAAPRGGTDARGAAARRGEEAPRRLLARRGSKTCPISAEKPLKERLTVREDGLLALDLQDTKITSLAPLAGHARSASSCSGIARSSPTSRRSREFRSLTYLDLDWHADHRPHSAARPAAGDALPRRHARSPIFRRCSGMKLKTFRSMARARLRSLAAGRDAAQGILRLDVMPTTDFSPLKGAPLEYVRDLGNSQLRDLSFLEGCAAQDALSLRVRCRARLVELPETSRRSSA